MKMSAEEYGRRVRRVGPPSPLGRDCLWAFGVGGGICLLPDLGPNQAALFVVRVIPTRSRQAYSKQVCL